MIHLVIQPGVMSHFWESSKWYTPWHIVSSCDILSPGDSKMIQLTRQHSSCCDTSYQKWYTWSRKRWRARLRGPQAMAF